jgi:hypothetical protein
MFMTFTTEAPFAFPVALQCLHTPLTVFHKMLRTFGTEAPFFSVARHTMKAPGATLPRLPTKNSC